MKTYKVYINIFQQTQLNYGENIKIQQVKIYYTEFEEQMKSKSIIHTRNIYNATLVYMLRYVHTYFE